MDDRLAYWEEQARRGTAGHMVWDILSDWRAEHAARAAEPLRWQPGETLHPEPNQTYVVLTSEGDVRRVRWDWTGREWRWCPWNQDVALRITITHWCLFRSPDKARET